MTEQKATFVQLPIAADRYQISSEPFDDTDFSWKNRATFFLGVAKGNVSFNVRMDHPTERGKSRMHFGENKELKKINLRAGASPRIAYIVLGAIKAMAKNEDGTDTGLEVPMRGYFYTESGEKILKDGSSKPVIISRVKVFRDKDGIITLGIKEEEHPIHGSRVGINFQFKADSWHDLCVPGSMDDNSINVVKQSNIEALAWVESVRYPLAESLKMSFVPWTPDQANGNNKSTKSAPKSTGDSW